MGGGIVKMDSPVSGCFPRCRMSYRSSYFLLIVAVCSIILGDNNQVSGIKWPAKKISEEDKIKAQEIQDAAMGTITTLEPGKEKEPVTCDEIMAKAVVNANEAKSTAIVMKESAIELASNEKKRADLLASQIDDSLAKVGIVEKEMDDLRLSTVQSVDENKREADAMVEEITKQASDDIEQIKKEMEDLKLSTTQTVDEHKRSADAMVEQKNAEANDDIKRIEKEMEDLKLSTVQTIDENKRLADAMVEQNKKEASDEILQIEGNMENLNQSTAQIIEEKQRAANALVEQRKKEASDEIKQIEEEMNDLKLVTAKTVNDLEKDSLHKIAEALEQSVAAQKATKDSVDEQKRIADALVEKIELEADAKVNQITKESIDSIDKAEEMARATQEAAKSEANEKVSKAERDAENQVREIKEQLAALEQSSAAHIEKTTIEAKNLVETGRKEAQNKISKAAEQAANEISNTNMSALKVIEAAKDEISNAKEEARLLVVTANEDATRKEKKVEDESNAQIRKIQDQAAGEVKDIEARMENLKTKSERDLMKTEEEAKKKIEGVVVEKKEVQRNMGEEFRVKKDRIASLEKIRDTLQNDLTNTKKDLQYWKIVHEGRTYVNATLIIEDTNASLKIGLAKADATLKRAISSAREKLEPILTQMPNIWQPYHDKLTMLYETHLKETVDKIFLPALVPPYEKFVIPCMKTIEAKHKLALEYMRQASVSLFVFMSDKLQKFALFLKNFLIEKDERKVVPAFVLLLLESVANNASWFLSIFLKITTVSVLFLLRSTIFRLIWKVPFIPYRMIQFLLRRKKKKVSLKKEEDNKVVGKKEE